MKDTDWEILYELHKNPNMTKVANILYMTQPSLTKRIQHIEIEFQVTIVERTPKGLSFTPEGEYLAQQAEEYLLLMKRTKDHLRELRRSAAGLITIGASYTYSKFTLTDLLLRYRLQHPNVNIQVLNEPSNLLFRRMLEGTIDVGFIRGDYEGAVNQTLMGQDAACVVTKEPVALEQLPSLKRINYKTNVKTHTQLDDWWRDWYGTEPEDGMEVGYVDVAWQMVQRGMGYTICFVPEHFENQYPDLCLHPLCLRNGTPVMRNTWFIYSKNKRIPHMLEQFIHHVEQEESVEGRSKNK